MMFNIREFFDVSKKMLFLAAQTEGAAERLNNHDTADVVFKRTAEFQLELVQAIEHVLFAGSIRPAFSTLRTLLEITVSFSWLVDDFDNRIERFIKGQCPSPQKMMSRANLGWDDEYRKTYSPLSDFVHGSFVLSDFNKIELTYGNKGDVPYSALADYFIIKSEQEKLICQVENLPTQELVAKHGGYIAVKTFDLALTMLIRASGDYSDAFTWWPGREHVERFDHLVKNYWVDMHFLWLSEKQRLAICRIDGKYA